MKKTVFLLAALVSISLNYAHAQESISLKDASSTQRHGRTCLAQPFN